MSFLVGGGSVAGGGGWVVGSGGGGIALGVVPRFRRCGFRRWLETPTRFCCRLRRSGAWSYVWRWRSLSTLRQRCNSALRRGFNHRLNHRGQHRRRTFQHGALQPHGTAGTAGNIEPDAAGGTVKSQAGRDSDFGQSYPNGGGKSPPLPSQ